MKVLDFGLAKLRPEMSRRRPAGRLSHHQHGRDQAGMILGTAAYMSPEQARGKVVDKRADIWAFGVVLYEMLTGRRLFEGEDVTETLALVIKGEPKWEGIPAKVQRLLKSCLEKDPKRRLRDIGDAWRLLEEAPAQPLPPRSRLGIVALACAAACDRSLGGIGLRPLPREAARRAEVVRFQISLPAQNNFTSATPQLSPDGRRVAFARWRGWPQSIVGPLAGFARVAAPGRNGRRFQYQSSGRPTADLSDLRRKAS